MKALTDGENERVRKETLEKGIGISLENLAAKIGKERDQEVIDVLRGGVDPSVRNGYDLYAYPDDCFNQDNGVPYAPKSKGTGYMMIPALETYYRRRFDAAFYNMLSVLRPSQVRVVPESFRPDDTFLYDATTGEITEDHFQAWRVTVYVDAYLRVQLVEQEVEVQLPFGLSCGREMEEIMATRPVAPSEPAPPKEEGQA